LAAQATPQAAAGGPNPQRKWGPCDCCKTGNHAYLECPIFKSKTPQERLSFISQSGRCPNCFSPKHKKHKCLNENRCSICKGSHHSTLHFPMQNQTQVPKEKGSLENAGMCLNSGSKEKKSISTCPIVALHVTNPANGKVEKTYAMLDEFSIIDKSLAPRLGVRTDKEKITVTTLASTVCKE
jgi:hypothetical protein